MERVELGKTGEMVSQLCLGAMIMGTTTDRETSFAMLDEFLAAGGSFIDTANCYAWWIGKNPGGESETLLGEWMKERGNRDQVFLATKGGAAIPNLGAVKDADGNIAWENVRANYEYLSPAALRKALEGSLRRLQVETIDLYYVHIDDRETSIEETLEELDCFVREGKVRYIGCSNFETWRLERSLNISRAHRLAQYVALQNEYSYFRPRPGTDFGIGAHTGDEQLDYLRANPEVTLLGYSPLLKGIYDDPAKRERYYNWHIYNTEDNRARLEKLSKMAAELGVSNNQLVLAWLLHHRSPRIIPIMTASGMEQFHHNMAALEIQLSQEQLAVLNEA